MISKEHIQKLLGNYLQDSEVFVVHVDVRLGNKIIVQIDKDNGINIQDCVEVSRFIEKNLDRETYDFSLDVSSPGADKPLKFLRQYPRNVGRKISVKLKNQTTVEGTLTSVEGNKIVVLPEKEKKNAKTSPEPITLDFEQILESKIILSI